MKTYLVIVIVSLALPHIAIGDEPKYGQRNGYDWQKFDHEIRKLYYIIGIFDLATFESKIDPITSSTTDSFALKYNYSYRVAGIAPKQVVKGLDEFYSHYENMLVLILDAIHIIQMKIRAVEPKDVGWWTRYYRGTKQDRLRMSLELKKTREKAK